MTYVESSKSGDGRCKEMHESIAKAKVKGTQRAVKNSLAERLSSLRDGLNKPRSIGRKAVLSEFESSLGGWGDNELLRFVQVRSSSWHKKSFQMLIFPTTSDIDGKGRLQQVYALTRDTKKLSSTRGNLGIRLFYSNVFVHEHFLTRLVQRSDAGEFKHLKSVIGNLVFILMYIYQTNIANKKTVTKRHYHIITPKHVIIATYHADNKIYIINTMIVRERFTKKQTDFYSFMIKDMQEHSVKCAAFDEETKEGYEFEGIVNDYKTAIARSEALLIESDPLTGDMINQK